LLCCKYINSGSVVTNDSWIMNWLQGDQIWWKFAHWVSVLLWAVILKKIEICRPNFWLLFSRLRLCINFDNTLCSCAFTLGDYFINSSGYPDWLMHKSIVDGDWKRHSENKNESIHHHYDKKLKLGRFFQTHLVTLEPILRPWVTTSAL
jgi:hypothetical protein